MATVADLDRALEYLLDVEGGWSNNPADRGGATKWGVTQAVYDRFRATLGSPHRTVGLLTKDEARRLYDTLFWQSAGCDRLPWPLSYVLFDAAVNSGPGRAIRWVQQGLKVPIDGHIGGAAIAAANTLIADMNAGPILDAMIARSAFLTRLIRMKPSQLVFLGGWWTRTMKVLARALVDFNDDKGE